MKACGSYQTHYVHTWEQNSRTHSFVEILIYTNKKEMKEEVGEVEEEEKEEVEEEEKEVEVIRAVTVQRGTVRSRSV